MATITGLSINRAAKAYIDCVVAHFEALARFIPVVDEIYKK